MEKLIFKEESFKIIGCCMEIHKILGKGFSEIVYKDALEYEFQLNSIPYIREAECKIPYKNITLKRTFDADFLVYENIIIEVKAIECLPKGDIRQALNYLKAAKLKLGLLVNFGEDSLNYKRVVL